MKFNEAFHLISVHFNRESSEKLLLDLVPNDLRNQEVFYSNSIETVTYYFGSPYTHNSIPFAYASTQSPLLSNLFISMYNASILLKHDDFVKYIKYLFNPEKHTDALLEMRPLFTSVPFKSIEYEINGVNGKKIDWKITYNNKIVIFDVKNRTGDTYKHLIDIVKNKGQISIPEIDPIAFFNSTYQKFNANNSIDIMQGIWFHVGIKVDSKKLIDFFDNKIDPSLMDFFIICGWEAECFIYTRTNEQKKVLLELFQLTESKMYTF